MKKLVLTAAALLLATSAFASNTDPVFYTDQGKLVIPNLKVGNFVYYAVLYRQGTTYTFSLDLNSAAIINGTLSFTPAAASDLVGSWSPVDEPGISFTLNANGTYSITMPAMPGDPDCANGGTESGNYQYEPTTGVFLAIATADNNGKCGFSHPTDVERFKKSGTDLYLIHKEEGKMVETKLVKKP